jgi:hypothetical protein
MPLVRRVLLEMKEKSWASSLTVDSANAFEGEAPDSSVALFFHLKATLLSQWRVLSRSLRNSDLVFAL